MSREPAAPGAPRDVLGRTAVLVSLGLHVGGFLIAFGVPRLLAQAPRAYPVYVVDLVSLPGGGIPSPAPAAGAPPRAAAPKPAPPKAAPPPPKKPAEKAIVLPDKSAKKPVAKKIAPVVKPELETKPPEKEPDQATGESPDASAQPQTAAPAAAPATGGTAAPGAGGAGESGAGGGGQGTGVGGDEYNFYLALLDRSIKGAWKRPLYNGREIFSATVRLQISRTGRVVKLELVQPSGLDLLDRSALKAVRDAEPFPPFPSALTIDTLPVQIVFELNPEGTGAEAPGP